MREFSIVRELSRREIESHSKRFIGITITKPEFREQGELTEWVCDIRVGVHEGWAVIKDCLIAQWAVGAITDMNVPVLAEKSVSGRVTIIARSDIRLPDIVLDTYSYDQLEFAFMRNLRTLDDGSVVDGFGHLFAEAWEGGYEGPDGETTTYTLQPEIIEWDSTDFAYGETEFNAVAAEWEES